jgi:transcription elongation factor GreA
MAAAFSFTCGWSRSPGEVPVVDEHTLAPDSPMGLALAGHRPGDVVTFETPQGPQQVELVAVRYPD